MNPMRNYVESVQQAVEAASKWAFLFSPPLETSLENQAGFINDEFGTARYPIQSSIQEYAIIRSVPLSLFSSNSGNPTKGTKGYMFLIFFFLISFIFQASIARSPLSLHGRIWNVIVFLGGRSGGEGVTTFHVKEEEGNGREGKRREGTKRDRSKRETIILCIHVCHFISIFLRSSQVCLKSSDFLLVESGNDRQAETPDSDLSVSRHLTYQSLCTETVRSPLCSHKAHRERIK